MRLELLQLDAWRRPAEESAGLAALVAVIMIVFGVGRARYEGVTTLAIGASATGADTTPLSPPMAAQSLLAQANRRLTDPPLPEGSPAREFRVDVLRNQELQLVCVTESLQSAAAACELAARDAASQEPRLRLAGPTVATMRFRERIFAAVWPALLAALGWFFVRTSRVERSQRMANAEAAREWKRASTVSRASVTALKPASASTPPPLRASAPSRRPPITIASTMLGMPPVAKERSVRVEDVKSAPPSLRAITAANVTPAGVSAASVSVATHRTVRPSIGDPAEGWVTMPSRASSPPSAAEPEPRQSGFGSNVIYHVRGGTWSADPNVVKSQTLERIRELRDQFFAEESSRGRLVRVTSGANSRYAKTHIAAQLAWTFAERSDKRVLLVEGDLDAPALHKVLHISLPRGFGFSEQLERLATNENGTSISVLSLSANLHALVEGKLGTPALFDSTGFVAALEQLREEHDVIVIDGPVVDELPDTRSLQRRVDMVTFVVAAGTSLPDAMKLSNRHFEGEKRVRTIKAGDWPDA